MASSAISTDFIHLLMPEYLCIFLGQVCLRNADSQSSLRINKPAFRWIQACQPTFWQAFGRAIQHLSAIIINMPGSQNISAKWVGWVKCNSLRDRRAIQMSCIHELALLSLLSNFLWNICNCRPAELHLNCTRLRLSSTSISTHSEPRTQSLWQLHKQRMPGKRRRG